MTKKPNRLYSSKTQRSVLQTTVDDQEKKPFY